MVRKYPITPTKKTNLAPLSIIVQRRDLSSRPTPPNFERESTIEGIRKSLKSMTVASISKQLKGVLNTTIDIIVNPYQTWKLIKETVEHYWVGSKLLWSEIKIAKDILNRVLGGHSMTRRERIQLVRTTTDIFRLVPFSIFIIIPFMELLLPFALRLFPNMLPSTFQDNLKQEESLKQELQMRLAVAKFMKDTLQEMAKNKSSSEDESGAQEVVNFIEKARLGEPIPNDAVVRIARLFKDELTLSNIPRPQLVSMCQYMGLQPFGADSFLRFQLRNKLRIIKEDDRRILWEGIDSLNTVELRDACRERGMRSLGVTQFKLRKQLQEWLDLSTQKHIPISLLIMSRGFMLSEKLEKDPEQVLKSSMSFLDSDTINEIVIDAASRGEADTTDMRKRKLDSIQFQKEMMEEERLEQEEAIAKTKSKLSAAAAATAAELEDVQVLTDTQTTLENAGSRMKEEVVGDRAQIAADMGTAHVLVSPDSTVAATVAAAAPPLSPKVPTRAAVAGEVLGPEAQAPIASPPVSQTATVESVLPLVEKDEEGGILDKDYKEKAGQGSTTTLASMQDTSADQHLHYLTVHELVALSDLARGSSLNREMSELAVLEAYLESLPLEQQQVKNRKTKAKQAEEVADLAGAASAVKKVQRELDIAAAVIVAEGSEDRAIKKADEAEAGDRGSIPDEEEEEEVEKEDKSVTRMKSAVQSMVTKLKTRMDMTEKALGDKLKLLDKDGDGNITQDEIKDVIANVMKKGDPTTQQNVIELFNLMDSNKDGKVSVVELLAYIQTKREKMEVAAIEKQMRKSSSAATALATVSQPPTLPVPTNVTSSASSSKVSVSDGSSTDLDTGVVSTAGTATTTAAMGEDALGEEEEITSSNSVSNPPVRNQI